MKYELIVRFPGMKPPVVCPSFWEIKPFYGCKFNCSYCYLLGTLWGKKIIPWKKYMERMERLGREILDFLKEEPPCLLNSGELADSLMMEKTVFPFVPWITEVLQEFGNGHKHLIVTKDVAVHHLLEIDGQDVNVVSFSVNPLPVWRWEKLTPHPERRLKAARKLQNAGYEVRIRIDFPVWEAGLPLKEILRVVENHIDFIYRYVEPSRFTLGVPRINNPRLWRYSFWQRLKKDMEKVGRNIWRYNREKSLEIYRREIDKIREYDSKVPIALCKETMQMYDALELDYENIKCNCIL